MGRVVILGGTGFIGLNIARHLQERGRQVAVFSRPRSPGLRFAGEFAPPVVYGNLENPASLQTAFREAEAVVHAAGYYPTYIFGRKRQLEAARRQMRNVIAAARTAGVSRIVYISSLATLGPPDFPGQLVDESTPLEPPGYPALYHQIKYAMEREFLLACQSGLPGIVLVPTGVFGPYDHKPTSGRIVLDLLRGRLPVFVEGRINVVDVRDLAAVVGSALAEGRTGERYIVANWNGMLSEFLAAAAQLSGRRAPRFTVPLVLARVAACASEWISRDLLRRNAPFLPVTALDLLRFSWFVSNDKIRREFGFTPRPLRETLQDTIDWYRRNGYVR